MKRGKEAKATGLDSWWRLAVGCVGFCSMRLFLSLPFALYSSDSIDERD